MARLEDRLARNVDGPFYVDRSCIDCETCRLVDPRTFGRDDDVGMSIVHAQPSNDAEALRAAMALVACPTSSIGVTDRADTLDVKAQVKAASRAFPELLADDVHYCGYASERSYGASSYFVRRPKERGGNVLIDSPRAAKPLIETLRAMGGVSTMFLTHRDDVADHALFHQHFGCERILHRDDVSSSTRDVERKLQGEQPIAIDQDFTVIPVPGHTPGSAALLYRPAGREGVLFTGDHLWWSTEARALEASRSVCWYSWGAQTRSMERLLAHSFSWVLPGHGAPHRAESESAMHHALSALVASMHR